MPIPDEIIEQVRDAADLVSLIGEHVELKRTGSDYRGPCPFHGGTHRNFAVIPKKGMYYCFVCHEAGDVFTFFMKRFGMEYPAAVRDVAGRCGITIPERPTGGPDPREPLYSAVATAEEWYARRLRDADDAAPAREYVAQRGFDLEALGPHRLGFAPRGPAFLEGMDTLGITHETLLEAGLAVRREDGSVRPRFWNRLLFPIHDLRGRVVGFGGRVLGDGEPKYLNSPDSPVFHKGALLYNLHHAKHPIRKAERAVVVEGYFDVLRLVLAGIEEVVAPLGTSLTAEQAQLLKRYTTNVALLYDSDTAGLRASFRAADQLLGAGHRVTLATSPAGEDPDTLARNGGAAAVTAVLDDALDVLERKVQLLDRKGWLGTISGRRRALDRLVPTLRAARDPVTRDLYVGRAAEALGISRQSVEQELAAGVGRWRASAAETHPAGRAPAAGSPAARRRTGRPERELLRVMLHEPTWRARIAEQLRDVALDAGPERTLLTLLAADPALGGPQLLERVDGEARTVVAGLLADPWGAINVDAVVDGALRKIEARAVAARIRAIDREIPVATEQEKGELAREKDRLSRRFAKLDPGRWKVIERSGRRS